MLIQILHLWDFHDKPSPHQWCWIGKSGSWLGLQGKWCSGLESCTLATFIVRCFALSTLENDSLKACDTLQFFCLKT